MKTAMVTASVTDIELRAIEMRVQQRIKFFLEPDLSTEKRILLVGDRPAPDAPDDDRFHFVPFGAMRHSSLWLNLQLTRAGIPEHELGWVNAFDRHGVQTSPEIFKRKWFKVIALGGHARKFCENHLDRTKFLHTYHPQYWKRFRSSEPYELIEMIQNLRFKIA